LADADDQKNSLKRKKDDRAPNTCEWILDAEELTTLKAAAGNFGRGKEVMAVLLDKRGDQVQITEDVVKAAAGNERRGKEVMALLLDKRRDWAFLPGSGNSIRLIYC